MYCTFLQIFLIICGGTIMPFAGKELFLDKKTYKTVQSLRQPQKLCLVYRQVQIFVGVFLSVVGYLLVPAQTLITQLVVFSPILLTQHERNLGSTMKLVTISWNFIVVLTWIIILSLSGQIYQYGEMILLSWKYHKWETRFESKLMSKFRKSSKPFMINCGRTFVVRRITVLKFIRDLTTGVFRALMTVGKH